MDINDSDRATIYYGWWVLLAGAITEMLAIGSTSYAAGLFVLPLQQELSLSRAEANSSIPLLFSGGALLAPLVGSLFDRYPVEHVMRVGGLLLGAGLFIAAAVLAERNALWIPGVVLIAAAVGSLVA